MRNLTKITFALIFLIGCKNITEQSKSNFNLELDYAEFQSKITELDTLKIWIAIGSCLPPFTAEKLTITKKNGIIKIIPEFNKNIQKTNKYIKQPTILISENDTIWKFGDFLRNNEFRLHKTEKSKKYGALQITHNSQKIHFYTQRLSDYNILLKEYFKTMANIKPKTDYYFNEIEIIENEKMSNK